MPPSSTAPFLSPSTLTTLVFAALLLAGLALRLWLATRQIRHVAQHRGAVPAAFAERITLAAHQKAADYTIAKARFGLLSMALSTAVVLGWTLLGGLDALNQQLLAWLGGGMPQQLALLAGFALIGGALDLPASLYQTFRIEQRFGFNQMTPRLWLTDLVKSTLIGAVIGLPIAALILWLMGAAGPLWWLWAWGVWMGFNLLLLLIYPTFIAPLFNKFQPLEDESLKARVQALMARCGFAAKGLFVMDGSRRSAHGNAYFTGMGRAKRIVFFDTLLSRLSGEEVEAVLAHELGHFKHRHITQRIVVSFALSLAGLWLLGWLARQSWFYQGLGVPVVADVEALALLLFFLVLPTFTFLLQPIASLASRRHEFQADAFAARQSSAQDLASALVKLYEDNAATLTPDPIHSAFYDSHPPAAQRIGRLNALAAGGVPA